MNDWCGACRKNVHPNRKEAKVEARRLSKKEQSAIAPYRCPDNPRWWHVGHPIKSVNWRQTLAKHGIRRDDEKLNLPAPPNKPWSDDE